MLFDEKDLTVFETSEARLYFKEILQSYYSQNYRATVVLLYSFVIYDLFTKLQTMASEGDNKAERELEKINQMIEDDKRYSSIENAIVDFFKRNCSLHFGRFIEDIDYLKSCRDKCAHLKVNDNTLFVPNDYHAKMLVCSMYDNILSVKAPFIMDLFPHVKSDIERYSEELSYSGLDIEDPFIKNLSNKYFRRMTDDSLRRSYRTFIKLLFSVDDDEAKDNILGLYAFTYAITDFMVEVGKSNIIEDESIQMKFSKISVEEIQNNDDRRNVLINLMLAFPVILDSIRKNDALFEYVREKVLSKPHGLKHYRLFYPSSKESMLDYYDEHAELHKPEHIIALFELLNKCKEFSIDDFIEEMVASIPKYNGYDSADCFMSFFIKHFSEFSQQTVEKVLEVYNSNNQCINRARHSEDIDIVNAFLDEQNKDDTDDIPF